MTLFEYVELQKTPIPYLTSNNHTPSFCAQIDDCQQLARDYEWLRSARSNWSHTNLIHRVLALFCSHYYQRLNRAYCGWVHYVYEPRTQPRPSVETQSKNRDDVLIRSVLWLIHTHTHIHTCGINALNTMANHLQTWTSETLHLCQVKQEIQQLDRVHNNRQGQWIVTRPARTALLFLDKMYSNANELKFLYEKLNKQRRDTVQKFCNRNE